MGDQRNAGGRGTRPRDRTGARLPGPVNEGR